jgi:ADP-heptose:LPS heptosyltransferase
LPSPPEADRILVIRLGAVGDVVRTLPAVSALRRAYPGSRLAWLVERSSASVLEGQPWLDEVIVFPREELREALRGARLARAAKLAWEFRRRLRKRRFDLVVDFHSILKSGVLSTLTGASRRVAYARPFGRELGWWFAHERARLHPRRMSRFARNDALVRYLGVTHSPAARPLAFAEPSLEDASFGPAGEPGPVAIHPGTSDSTPHKRWTAEGYAAVARGLREREGLRSVVTVGPAQADRELAEAIVEAADGAASLAPETPGLVDLAALFSRCSLYVGSDTGPMHIASLAGTPVVQLLGPTDPVENAPWEVVPSRTVRVQIGCNPCRRGCAAATCMGVIRPESVLAAARALIAGGR